MDDGAVAGCVATWNSDDDAEGDDLASERTCAAGEAAYGSRLLRRVAGEKLEADAGARGRVMGAPSITDAHASTITQSIASLKRCGRLL